MQILESDERYLHIMQIRELYARAAYVHKVHEKQAALSLKRHRTHRYIQVALATVGAAIFLTSLLALANQVAQVNVAVSFVALLLGCLSLFGKDFDCGADVYRHYEVAARALRIRESYISLLTDLQSGKISLDQAVNRRDSLVSLSDEAFDNAPIISGKAYSKAQQALKQKEELFFTDDQIDMMLPPALRLELGKLQPQEQQKFFEAIS